MKVEHSDEGVKPAKQRKMPLYRQPIFVALILLAIVGVVAGVVLLAKKQSTGELSNQAAAVDEETEEPPTPVMESDDESGDKEVLQYEGENPNNLSELTGIITGVDVEEGNIVIRTMIDQFVTSGGNCELTLSSEEAGSTYVVSTDVVPDISTSHCEDFVVPTAGLKQGKYQIRIIVTGENKKGVIESEVNI